MRSWLRFAFVAFVALSATYLGRTAPPPGLDLEAEVPASTSVVTGRLDNGLGYAVMRHTAKPGQISLRLLVNAGSLHEADDELGYAHFVEHMAFNGTRHFRSGELVKFLQRQGVAFGPHLNASTTADHTGYRLDLTTNAAAQLETGMEILRDFADGILFEPKEVQRERGVIVSEAHRGQTLAGAREIARTSFLYAGTRFPHRPPIGTEASVNHATAAGLRAFYDAWYRPERLSVIIVGDLDAAKSVALIQAQFGSLTARGPARPEPVVGELPQRNEPAVAFLPVLNQAALQFEFNFVWERPIGPLRWRDLAQSNPQQAVAMLFALRLNRLKTGDNAAFASVDFSLGDTFRGYSEFALGFCPPNDWGKTLATIEQEMRRVIEYGFTPDELANLKQGVGDFLLREAEDFSDNEPAPIAEAIVDAFKENRQYIDPPTRREQSMHILDHLTEEDCQTIFREIISHGPPAIFVTGPSVQFPAPEQIREVLTHSIRTPVSAPEKLQVLQFAYTDFGPAGTILRKEHDTELDLWKVEFANGVRLNLKRTSHEPGRVQYRLRVGEGRLLEPPEQPGLNYWTSAWLFGGLGKHPWADILRLMEERSFELNYSSEDQCFQLGGRSRPEQLDFMLELFTAYVADAAFRPEGCAETSTRVNAQFRPFWATTESLGLRVVLPRLAGGDSRIGLPSDAGILLGHTNEQLRDWMAPLVAAGRPEISLVGEFDIEAAIAAAARTFGALPQRTPTPIEPTLRILKFPNPPLAELITLTCEAPLPARLELFWPVREALTPRQRPQFNQLAAILNDRVRIEIREKKGATYAVQTEFTDSAAFPGFTHLHCALEVKPEQAEKYCNVVRDLAASLARRGVTREELARAQAQAVSNVRTLRQTNAYWLDVLADDKYTPDSLAAARTLDADVASVTKGDLDALAARYLRSDQSFLFIIMPKIEGKTVPQTAPPAKP